MRDLYAPFCDVCSEAMVLAFYGKVRPIDAYAPVSTNYTVWLNEAQTFSLNLLLPTTHNLSVQWATNGSAVPGATNSTFTVMPLALGDGVQQVTASVVEPTPLVRNDPANRLRQTVTWTLNVNLVQDPLYVSVQTVPAGLAIMTDGTNITSAQTSIWEAGSCHTLGAPSPQDGAPGTRYRWAAWSGGGAMTNVVCPSSDTTYTAIFTNQYYLTMNSGAGGAANPASGWYDAGASVSLAATPAGGFAFSGWTGTGPGSYTGSNNPATVSLTSGPLSETAQFVNTNPCNYAVEPSGTNIGPGAFSGGFGVVAGGGCAWSAVADASWIHTTSGNGSGSGSVAYTVDANPGTSSRSGTITVQGQTFAIYQAATAVFVKGVYTGLFWPANGATAQNSGLLSVNTTTKGAFTGKVYVDGGSYPFRGQFDTTGQTNVVVPRHGNTQLTLHLQLDGQDVLTGTAGVGAWPAPLHADRAVFSSANPCAIPGLYTFRIAGDTNPAALPGGDSYGTFKVASGGRVTLAGSLADNTKVTQSTYIAQDGRVPLFVALYRGAGLMMGWIQFPADASGSLNGQPLWFKPPMAKGYYPFRFDQQVLLSGMKYTAPVSRQPVFAFTNGTVTLGGGNLPQPLAVPVRILANNRVVPSVPIKLRMTLNAASGKFSGSFSPSSSGRGESFQGILIRPLNGGFGYFLGTNQSGYVRIEGP